MTEDSEPIVEVSEDGIRLEVRDTCPSAQLKALIYVGEKLVMQTPLTSETLPELMGDTDYETPATELSFTTYMLMEVALDKLGFKDYNGYLEYMSVMEDQ